MLSTTTSRGPAAEPVAPPSGRARVGVVVVNHRSHHLLREGLDPDGRLAREELVVVVDSGSSAAERRAVASLAAERGWVLVAIEGNPGFGAGVNVGAAAAFEAGCDCVVLLNPDARVPADVVLELARGCRDDPGTMVSPRLLDGAGRPHFHGSDVELASGRIRGRHLPRRGDDGWSTGASRVRGTGLPWLTGACLAVHRDLLTALGGFDERYFLYWEDVDLAYRAARHGARLLVRQDLVGHHDEGGTQGRRRGRALSARYYYYNARNRLRFAARHLPRPDVVRWLVHTPAVTREILLRGGRRQLLSPVPLLAVTAGALAGVAHAVRSLPAAPVEDPLPARAPGTPLRVTIAMLTFHRPDDLAAAVPLLGRQCDAVTDDATVVDVLVVDNDPAGTGAAAVAALGDPRVRGVVEPMPGIAAARNRALAECADRDVLVFVDDDERPHDGWLRHLLTAYRRTGAGAVVGPVLSRFDGPLDPWLVAGGFFARRRLGTGTPVDVAATNNLLLDLDAVRAAGVRFDVRFGLSGVGEDTLFTRALSRAGVRLVWCDEAVVTDVVPASRMTRSWVLRRALSTGSVGSIVAIAVCRTAPGRALARGRELGRGAVRCFGGAARALLGVLVRSPRHQARGVRTLLRGVGVLAGAVGLLHEQHGTGPTTRNRVVRSAVR